MTDHQFAKFSLLLNFVDNYIVFLCVMCGLKMVCLKYTSLVVHSNIQWNLSYPNPLGPGVVHKSEKSVSLKLCINNLKQHL